MKQFRTLFLAVAVMLGATAFINAQSKVAHIASQELIESLPAYEEAMNQLQALQRTYDTEIRELMTEAQSTFQRYEAEATTMTDEQNAQRANELQQTQRSIGEYRNNAMEELQQKEMELLQPILESARETIQKVARDKGYDYVLDSTTGAGLLMADGYDLMPDVKAELGL